jgi:hypothetical protein
MHLSRPVLDPRAVVKYYHSILCRGHISQSLALFEPQQKHWFYAALGSSTHNGNEHGRSTTHTVGASTVKSFVECRHYVQNSHPLFVHPQLRFVSFRVPTKTSTATRATTHAVTPLVCIVGWCAAPPSSLSYLSVVQYLYPARQRGRRVRKTYTAVWVPTWLQH